MLKIFQNIMLKQKKISDLEALKNSFHKNIEEKEWCKGKKVGRNKERLEWKM
jgi:hypothetical protein